MIEPMLLKSCKDKSLKKYEGTHIAQEKFDGTRIIVVKENGKIQMQTRSGKNDLASEYMDITKELLAEEAESFILDGELVFINKKTGRVEFLTGLAKETRAEYEPKLMLFDVLKIKDTDMRGYKQETRTGWVEKFVSSGNFKHIAAVYTITSGFDESYAQVIDGGGEGLVLKKKTAIYKDGKRSADWLKIKKQDTADCFVIGLMKGEGKFEHLFGSLIMGQYDSSGNIKVVGATSGFDDSTRALLHAAVMKEPWFETYTSTKGELGHILHKVAPTIVIEISFMERLESGMFRHPRFERIRKDKLPKDCLWINDA